MNHAVPMDALPVDFQFPEKLTNRIRFDAGRHELVFHGFMSKSEYDQLLKLHSNIHYQYAIVRLFQLSTVSRTAQPKKRGRALAIATTSGLILAAVICWSVLRSSVPSSPASATDVKIAEEMQLVQR